MIQHMTKRELALLIDGYTPYDEETDYAAHACDLIFPEGTLILRNGETRTVHPKTAERLLKKRNAFYADRAIVTTLHESLERKGWLTPHSAQRQRETLATLKRRLTLCITLATLLAATSLALATVLLI